jgi:hypothetical protein
MTGRILNSAPSSNVSFSQREIWLGGLLLWGFGQSYYAVGDREFMMMALIFLYLLRFSPLLLTSTLPTHQRVLIGLLAGIGFCIKPHSIVLWLAVNAYSAITQRSWKVFFYLENVIVYAFATCFLLYVYVALPDYFNVILPLALKFYGYYVLDDKNLAFLVRILTCVVFTAVAFADWRKSQSSLYANSVPYYLCLLLTCFLYSAINNGWVYTMVPAWTVVIILVCLMYKHHRHIITHCSDAPLRCNQAVFGLLFMFLAYSFITLYTNIALGVQSIKNGFPVSQKKIEMLDAFNHQFSIHRASSFGALTVSHAPWYDVAVYSGIKWNLSINHFWMAPYFQVHDKISLDSSDDWRDHYVADKTAEDFEKRKPDLIFVPNNPEENALPLLSKSKKFLDTWKRRYRFSNTLKLCSISTQNKDTCVYYVYKRNIE